MNVFVIHWWPSSDWQYPFVFPSTHSSQESEFQETVSDRSDCRETEDGGLSGMEKNTSFLLFSICSPLHLQLIRAETARHRFLNGKSLSQAGDKKTLILRNCSDSDVSLQHYFCSITIYEWLGRLFFASVWNILMQRKRCTWYDCVWMCLCSLTLPGCLGGAEYWRLPWQWVLGQSSGRGGGLQMGKRIKLSGWLIMWSSVYPCVPVDRSV